MEAAMLANGIKRREALEWVAVFLASAACVAVLIVSVNKAKVTSRPGSPSDSAISHGREGTGLPAVPPYYGMNKICFVREHFVYVSDPQTGETNQIVTGEDCAISSLGESIAFTVDMNPPNKIGRPRTVKVFDLSTKAIKELSSLPQSNKMNPQWSPDGTKLALELSIENQSRVAILTLASGEWSDVTRNLDFLEPWGEINRFGVNLDSWSPDGKSILCHDLNYIYEIGLDGRTLQRLTLSTIVDPHQATISTASRFSFSEDRKLLLFDGNSEVQTGKSNLALYVFDFDKHSLSRITSETFEASHPRWLPTGKGIVFLRLEETPDDRAIFDVCVTSLDDHKVTTILKNTSSVSYSVE
jgi:Tol biopolymer transport system component